jgi:hypothetical protein
VGNPSFIVYIDESGDDGFVFPRSSEWLVMSAVLVPLSQHSNVIHRTQDILTPVGWSKGKSVHFGSIDHERRVFLASEIATLPVVVTSILAHKPSITESEALKTKRSGRFYAYTVRLLLERISWYCRDNRPQDDVGDGTVHLIFDNRTRGSYLQLRAYVNHLKEAVETSIHWPVVMSERIDARSPRDQACLHLPDSVAGSMRAALEISKFGHTEHRFAKILQPVTYQHSGRYRSYGLKFFPDVPNLAKNKWLIKYYGWK